MSDVNLKWINSIFYLDGGKSFDKESLNIKFRDIGRIDINPPNAGGPRKTDEFEKLTRDLEKKYERESKGYYVQQAYSSNNDIKPVTPHISMKDRLCKMLGIK